MEDKKERLGEILRGLESVVVAFSGGVDSALLLAAAHRTLGRERCLGVTGISPSLAPEEYEDARAIAEQIGADWTTIDTNELDDPGYLANDKDRCYYCKRELFTQLGVLARERGYNAVADGFNADDVGDWRPGGRAGQELRVASPLKEAGMSKDDIRELSHEYGLPTWDKPSFACLASRIPYGTSVTAERLEQVAKAETVLRQEGLRVLRVRYHGDTARLELGPDEIGRVADSEVASRIVDAFDGIGFHSVAVDLAGFRSGSQNETPQAEADLLQIGGGRAILREHGIGDAKAIPEGQMIRIVAPSTQAESIWSDNVRTGLVTAFQAMGFNYVALELTSDRAAAVA